MEPNGAAPLRDSTDKAPDAPPEPWLLHPEAAAHLLGVSRAQVYKLMRSGQLAAVKIGQRGEWRISRRVLGEFVSELEHQGRERARALRLSR